MNKDLKLLLISLLCLGLVVAYLYWQENYTCTTSQYQDLQGTHTVSKCTKDTPKNCWDNYSTEHEAILNCENK